MTLKNTYAKNLNIVGKLLAHGTNTHTMIGGGEKKNIFAIKRNMEGYQHAAIVRSECIRIQLGDDWYAYIACLLRNSPTGCSMKMLKQQMRQFCSDRNRQIQFDPRFPHEWNFAMRNVERLDRWPSKNLFVVIEKRPGGNGGRHTHFRTLTLNGLVTLLKCLQVHCC